MLKQKYGVHPALAICAALVATVPCLALQQPGEALASATGVPMADVAPAEPATLEQPDTPQPDDDPATGMENPHLDATEPVATESVATEPDTTEPVATEPVATEPVATEPVATEPVATELDATKPDGPQPDAAQPDAAQPDAAQPDAAQPDAAQADAAQSDAKQSDGKQPDGKQADETQPDTSQPKAKDGLIPLQPEGGAWLDLKKKRVVLVGRICLREGQLEMFACPQGTKEHESIVAVPVKAYVIHAALLALGAKPGSPTVFVPEFRPASGTRVDVSLYWTDESGRRRSAWAQDWVRHWRTGLPMQEHWVFAGSSFWVNEQTGEKYYQAEEGFLICLANFSTAMLDIPVESSDAAGQLVFEAFTERIPPLGTRVTVVLTPRLEESAPEEHAK